MMGLAYCSYHALCSSIRRHHNLCTLFMTTLSVSKQLWLYWSNHFWNLLWIIPPWATKQQMDVLEIPHESWKVYCNSHVTQEWGKSWCTCKLHVPCVMNWEFFLLKIPKMIGSTFLLKKWHFRLFYLSIRRSSKVFNVVQNLTTVG